MSSAIGIHLCLRRSLPAFSMMADCGYALRISQITITNVFHSFRLYVKGRPIGIVLPDRPAKCLDHQVERTGVRPVRSYSTLMLFALATSAQRVSSACTKSLNSAGELPTGFKPNA